MAPATSDRFFCVERHSRRLIGQFIRFNTKMVSIHCRNLPFGNQFQSVCVGTFHGLKEQKPRRYASHATILNRTYRRDFGRKAVVATRPNYSHSVPHNRSYAHASQVRLRTFALNTLIAAGGRLIRSIGLR